MSGRRMKPLSAERLRRTKERAVKRIVDQQQAMGVIPSPAQAEAFLEQEAILRRSELDHEADRDRQRTLPEKHVEELPTADLIELANREAKIDGVDGIKRPGDYRMWEGPIKPGRPETPNITAARMMFRFLTTKPLWKKRMEDILHSGKPFARIDELSRKLLFDAARAFPHKMNEFKQTARMGQELLVSVPTL
jgi:hypothetical protein